MHRMTFRLCRANPNQDKLPLDSVENIDLTFNERVYKKIGAELASACLWLSPGALEHKHCC